MHPSIIQMPLVELNLSLFSFQAPPPIQCIYSARAIASPPTTARPPRTALATAALEEVIAAAELVLVLLPLAEVLVGAALVVRTTEVVVWFPLGVVVGKADVEVVTTVRVEDGMTAVLVLLTVLV